MYLAQFGLMSSALWALLFQSLIGGDDEELEEEAQQGGGKQEERRGWAGSE
ncbi:hypothetical protein D3C81_2225210 [compost metagenome]